MSVFIIEDDFHAQMIGEYSTRDEAIAELRRIAGIAWGRPPNRPPCTNSARCRREYQVLEYDTSTEPRKELGCTPALVVTANGAEWLIDAPT